MKKVISFIILCNINTCFGMDWFAAPTNTQEQIDMDLNARDRAIDPEFTMNVDKDKLEAASQTYNELAAKAHTLQKEDASSSKK